MKKTIKNFLLIALICAMNITPVHATEIGEETMTVTDAITMDGETVQREERLVIEGYELPEVIDHNIGKIGQEELDLLERISICGKTSEFYFELDNSTNSVIPYNYINMMHNNYTPFTLYIKSEGEVIAVIETNGVQAQGGDFPAHVNIAQGVDFIQVSFDSELTDITGTFHVTFNCSDFRGRSYDVYENGSVVNTGKMDSTGVMKLNLSNTNTKTIKFIQPEIIKTSETDTQDIGTMPVTDSVPSTEKTLNVTYLIISIVAVIGLGAVLLVFIFLKKKGHK